MKKFIAYGAKGKTIIYECEVSVVRPKPFALKDGEELFKVEKPGNLYGEQWYSFFFQDSLEECKQLLEQGIRVSKERTCRKSGQEFCEELVAQDLSQVPVVKIS
jgi:hypothetical protein